MNPVTENLDAPVVCLLRLPAVLARTGSCRSSHYSRIADGLWTPPVAIGPRARAWPSDEVDLLIGARVAGYSDERIRQLVKQLLVARGSAVKATSFQTP